MAKHPQMAADTLWSLGVSTAHPEIEASACAKLDRPGKAFEVTASPISSLVKVAQPEDFYKAVALAWLPRRYQEALAYSDSVTRRASSTWQRWHRALRRKLGQFTAKKLLEQVAANQAVQVLATQGGYLVRDPAEPITQDLLARG